MMKLKGLLLVLFVCALNAKAQDYFPKSDVFDGKYYSLNKMGNPGQEVKEVFLAAGSPGTTKMMTLSLTEGGMPAYFVFDEAISKKVKKAVFRNRMSMVFMYDKNSLVMVREKKERNQAEGETLVDFFSKDKAKVAAMTKEKAMEYATQYAGEF
ncbi:MULTISPECIES: hypothetical protein [Polaribacter]|uniref:DUF4252 domain-containing protein n=1 Tax=Polaribacter sejongensis TaxID=985043 RepID=A0AAJ1QYY1_9FLAO|nr:MULTISPECIES: hypothetical protein [Polaribacter]MDN3620665.1 hypothetical protein [Polaribacter undariae]UWD32481.1 hypothetical protein NQP51_02140 [Polaribacter undariae]